MESKKREREAKKQAKREAKQQRRAERKQEFETAIPATLEKGDENSLDENLPSGNPEELNLGHP